MADAPNVVSIASYLILEAKHEAVEFQHGDPCLTLFSVVRREIILRTSTREQVTHVAFSVQ
jgi:hypothetical protein